MINIKEVIWTNFLGYGDYKNSLVFDDIKGICLIEGEIEGNDLREEGDEKLNAAGKTSAIEAIVWGLFGNTTRLENPGDKVINWHTGKNCRVSIKTADGYEIIRMRKYSGSSKGSGLTELLILKDGDDITKSTSLPAQEFINKTFGISYHVFVRSVVFGQFSNGFLELSDTKIRKVIENILGIDDFSPIIKTAKNKINTIDYDISSIDADINNYDRSIEKAERQLENFKDKSSSFDDEIKEELSRIKKDLDDKKINHASRIKSLNDLIENKRQEIESVKLVDIDKLKEEWSLYEDKLSEYTKNVENVNGIKSKINNLEHKLEISISKLKSITVQDKVDISKVKDILSKISKIKDEISKRHKIRQKLNDLSSDIKAKIKHDQDFINSDHDYSECPECRSIVDKSHLESKIKECTSSIKENNNKYNEIVSKLQKIDESIDNLNNKLNSIDIMSVEDAETINNEIDENILNRNALNEEISKINKQIHDQKETLKDIKLSKPDVPEITINEAKSNNELKDNLDNSILDIKDRISDINKEFKEFLIDHKAKINSIKNKKNPYDELISDEIISLNSYKESKQNSIEQKNKKKMLRSHIDYIRESYSNKRKIKAYWISELIPSFNRCLRYYLDFFEIDDKLEFDELLCHKLDKWGYDTHSGGECKRIDVSLMFGLADLHSINYGLQANFMVLDEVDGRVDPFTINKLVSLLSDDIINRDGIDNIFVISHRKEMKDRFPHKIKVKNKQGRSYIVNHE